MKANRTLLLDGVTHCGNPGFLDQEEYSKTCDARPAESCSNLVFLYEGGTGVSRDIGKAGSFYKKGCSLGDQWGCGQSRRLR